MNNAVQNFFVERSEIHPYSEFCRVIALHDMPDIDWEEVKEYVPKLIQGWDELAHLSTIDRIEFIKAFWLSKLPYQPKAHKALINFFDSLDDIGIFLTKRDFEETFNSYMVYSLKNSNSFYYGMPPAKIDDILVLEQDFIDYIFPEDYISFLKIHDGFRKHKDYGMINISEITSSYRCFQTALLNHEGLITSGKEIIEPSKLIPFYRSGICDCCQCFYAAWYPIQEMGNVFYSIQDNTISDYKNVVNYRENMAFATFLDWLSNYLNSQ